MSDTLSAPAAELLRKIEDRTAVVGVIGLGYVGLPLALEFARAGYKVIGFDVDQRKTAAVNRGESYIGDVPSADLAPFVKEGRLRAAAPGDDLGKCDCISICVPTPLRKSRDPDVSYIVNSAAEIAKRARPGQLITLESTTYPGTTTEIILPPMQAKGLKPGVDFFLAFSPERVDPGNERFKTRNTPKVIGGLTPACNKLVGALYSAAVDRVVQVSSPEAAEMVKLLENTFRSVNIGLVNEMAVMCRMLKCDVWEVIEAAATKPFGFMPFFPGPGLGGHCIPIDPLYLSWKLKSLNYNAKFIELADEINLHMPDYVVGLTAEALNSVAKPVNGSKVLLLGAAYKRNVDDYRESPALDVIELLARKKAVLEYADPHVPEIKLHNGTSMKAVPLDAARLKAADVVLIVTDHKAFDPRFVAEHASLIVDSRNLMKGVTGPAKIVRL
jgi:UDP-N-acetyl-D-glucosamine dehydrogenase